MFSLGGYAPPYDPADKRLVCIRSPCPAGPTPAAAGPHRIFPPRAAPPLRSPIDSVESLGWYETEGVGMGWDETEEELEWKVSFRLVSDKYTDVTAPHCTFPSCIFF